MVCVLSPTQTLTPALTMKEDCMSKMAGWDFVTYGHQFDVTEQRRCHVADKLLIAKDVDVKHRDDCLRKCRGVKARFSRPDIDPSACP